MRRSGRCNSFAFFHNQREIGNMARKKNDSTKAPAQPASVFEGLLFVAVAATAVAIIFLVLSLSRYEWALP